MTYAHIFGSADNGAAGVPVWDGATAYTYSTSADIDSISSSNTADLIDVVVIGLDETGVEVVQTVTLNGQNTVLLDTPLYRVYRMYNGSNTDLVGNVWLYTNGATISAGVPTVNSTKRALISAGYNNTNMCLYTVPLGKVAFLFTAGSGVNYVGANPTTKGYARVEFRVRRLDSVFVAIKYKTPIDEGVSVTIEEVPFPEPIPALTDLMMYITASSADVDVTASFQLLIVDEDKVQQGLKTLINQPTELGL